MSIWKRNRTEGPEEKRKNILQSIYDRMQTLEAKSFVLGMCCLAILLGAVTGIYLLLPITRTPSDPVSLAAYRKIAEIESIIDSRYLNEIDKQKQTDSMYLGLVAGLDDKYANYFTKEEYEKIRMNNNGQMEGIGVTILKDEEGGFLLVDGVQEDSPAEKAGVLKGDHILTIQGQETKDMTTSDAVTLIQSAEDGKVSLVLVHEDSDEEIEVTMQRAKISQQVVRSTMLEDKIGYISIASFNKQTAPQFQEAYDALNEERMEGLIIDLRGNLGGLVDACCDTLNIFMPKGNLVYERDRNGTEKIRKSEGKTPIEIPLVLLVNANTASASEMFTGAVQDYGIGTVVGTVTYGKGIEQDSFILSDGSVLKITTRNYFTPNDRSINGTGITPDIEVELDADAESDTQLDKALEVLKDGV